MLKYAIAAAMLAAAGAAQAGQVTVSVKGVQPNGGDVLVALQTEEQFLQSGGAYTIKVPATATSVTATFPDVPAARYAAVAVQDTDKDGTVTVGETGPSEPWGISGKAQKGKPMFAPAAVNVRQSGGRASVMLKAR